MRAAVAFCAAWLLCLGAGTAKQKTATPPKTRVFVATAHSQEGLSASGEESRAGTVAADPKVLPLGSIIRVTEAGKYSGTYKVIDTGSGVKGRHVDIYVSSNAEARRFGRRKVRVEVLRRGEETERAAGKE
jgi:3D (Asp-Asp-Asp) domain-containing protein